MSHFTVTVLIPQENMPEPGHPDFARKIELAVQSALEPFNEAIDVDPYDVPCSCAKNAAHSKAHDLSEQETGLSWETLRNQWWDVLTYEDRQKTTWDEHTQGIRAVFDRYHEELLAVFVCQYVPPLISQCLP